MASFDDDSSAGTRELDKLINSIEFENQQFIKLIEKENKLIEALQDRIDSKIKETEYLEFGITNLVAENRRMEEQLTQNKISIESLKSTRNIMADHEQALCKQVENLNIKTNEQGNFFKEKVDGYSEVYEKRMQLYLSFPWVKELNALKETLRHLAAKTVELENTIERLSKNIQEKEARLKAASFAELVIQFVKKNVSVKGIERDIENCEAEKTSLLTRLSEQQDITQNHKLSDQGDNMKPVWSDGQEETGTEAMEIDGPISMDAAGDAHISQRSYDNSAPPNAPIVHMRGDEDQDVSVREDQCENIKSGSQFFRSETVTDDHLQHSNNIKIMKVLAGSKTSIQGYPDLPSRNPDTEAASSQMPETMSRTFSRQLNESTQAISGGMGSLKPHIYQALQKLPHIPTTPKLSTPRLPTKQQVTGGRSILTTPVSEAQTPLQQKTSSFAAFRSRLPLPNSKKLQLPTLRLPQMPSPRQMTPIQMPKIPSTPNKPQSAVQTLRPDTPLRTVDQGKQSHLISGNLKPPFFAGYQTSRTRLPSTPRLPTIPTVRGPAGSAATMKKHHAPIVASKTPESGSQQSTEKQTPTTDQKATSEGHTKPSLPVPAATNSARQPSHSRLPSKTSNNSAHHEPVVKEAAERNGQSSNGQSSQPFKFEPRHDSQPSSHTAGSEMKFNIFGFSDEGQEQDKPFSSFTSFFNQTENDDVDASPREGIFSLYEKSQEKTKMNEDFAINLNFPSNGDDSNDGKSFFNFRGSNEKESKSPGFLDFFSAGSPDDDEGTSKFCLKF